MELPPIIQTALAPVAPPISDLGYANGWTETPVLVQKCRAMTHERWSRSIGRCLHEYGCDTCNYKFTVDSGD